MLVASALVSRMYGQLTNGAVTAALVLIYNIVFLYFFVLLFIFILHSRESKLYRYILDGTSSLAWELPFPRFMGHLTRRIFGASR